MTERLTYYRGTTGDYDAGCLWVAYVHVNRPDPDTGLPTQLWSFPIVWHDETHPDIGATIEITDEAWIAFGSHLALFADLGAASEKTRISEAAIVDVLRRHGAVDYYEEYKP